MTSDAQLDAAVRRVLNELLAEGDPYTALPLLDPGTKLLPPSVMSTFDGLYKEPTDELAEVVGEQGTDLAEVSGTVNTGRLSEDALSATIDGVVDRPVNTMEQFHRTLGLGAGRVLFLGDSWTEGTRGADSPFLRYVDHVAAGIRQAAQPFSIPGGMYIPSYATYSTRLPANWVYTGTTSQKQNTGPGYYNVEMANAATATLAFNGDGFRLMFDRRALDGGTAEVTIDGTLVATINSASGGNTYQEFTGLTRGKHTIVVTVTAGTWFSLQGAYVYDGDSSSGIITYPSGRGGIKSDALVSTGFNGLISTTAPMLATIMYGINDYRNAIPVATFKANLLAGIASIRALRPTVSLAIISCPEVVHPGTPLAPWEAYKTAMREVADEQGALLIDLSPAFGSGATDGSNGLWDVDQSHPNDAGHRAIGDAVLRAILPSPARATRAQDRLWIPAQAFTAAAGPAISLVNNSIIGWDLDQSATELIVTNLSIPEGWKSYDIDLWWFNKGTPPGDVRFRMSLRSLWAGQAIPGAAQADQQRVVAAGAQYAPTIYRGFLTGIVADPSGLVSLFVSRVGGDGTDTLAFDASVMGIMLRRTK